MSSATVQTPHPVPAHRGASPPQRLSEKEQVGYDHVLAHFANPDYVLPGVDTKQATLMEEERMWLSYECILRFLRATKYHPSECIKRLEAALKWRRDFGLYTHLTPEQVEAEAATSHMFLYGYDTQDRPIIYYHPSKQTSHEVQFFFWTIERATELMAPGVDSVAYMVDFAMPPSLSFTGNALHILQAHYPERLGLAAYINSPRLFTAFWEVIMPLMDTHTRSTLAFEPVTDERGLWRTAKARDLGEPDGLLVSSDQLMTEGFSGSVSFEYNHDVYWPALLTMCEERKKELTRVWQQLGGVVGIKEWDVKVGVRDGLAAPAATSEAAQQL